MQSQKCVTVYSPHKTWKKRQDFESSLITLLKYHRLCGFKKHKFISHISGIPKSKIKVSAYLVPDESLLTDGHLLAKSSHGREKKGEKLSGKSSHGREKKGEKLSGVSSFKITISVGSQPPCHINFP
jgi:hypothetical protein